MDDNQTYTVKEGDVLSRVASQFGVTTNEISGYASGNPDLIQPGEQLTIKTRAQAPANTVNANDLNTKAFQTPPVTPITGFDGLIKSSEAAITSLEPEVNNAAEKIQGNYDRLGDVAASRAEGYQEEGVYDKRAAYTKEVNKINQKELAFQARVDKIRNNNPTGQLADGQNIQIDQLTKNWAVEKAALSISAAFLKDDFELARSIVDDRVEAETEGLKTELAGLEFFYNQNFNQLSDERKNLLEFQIEQIAEEKAEVEQTQAEIGALQLAAAENGAPSSVIVGIGKSSDLTGAINAAGSWIDQTIDRNPGGSGGGFSTVDLAPEDERTLTGAGFSAQDIKDLQQFVSENGVGAALESDLTPQQKAAIKKVYNVNDDDFFTVDGINELVTNEAAAAWLEENYADDTEGLQDLAVDQGFKKGFLYRALPGDSKKKSVKEFLESENARQYVVDQYTQKARDNGLLIEK